MVFIGVSLGVLMGLISGAVAIAFLRAFSSVKHMSFKQVLLIATELLSLPTFWFGGPWVATKFIEGMDFKSVLPYYSTSLAIAFSLIFILPLVKFISVITRAIALWQPIDPKPRKKSEHTHGNY